MTITCGSPSREQVLMEGWMVRVLFAKRMRSTLPLPVNEALLYIFKPMCKYVLTGSFHVWDVKVDKSTDILFLKVGTRKGCRQL